MISVSFRAAKNDSKKVLDAFASSTEEQLFAAAQAAYERIEAPLASALRAQPGPVKYPIDWTSERQRRAYFATNGFGSGIPYKRTGGLSRSWVVSGERDGASYRVVVATDVPSAKYVVGSLRDVIVGRQRYQQRFHVNTGWFVAADVVGYWFDVFLDDLLKELSKR